MGTNLEKHQAAGLDTFAGWCICGGPWVLARRMNGKTGSAVAGSIESLEQQCFVHVHLREVVPALSRVVQGQLKFANALLGLTFDRDQVTRFHRRCVAQHQRMVVDGPGNRTPHVDDGESSIQELLRFVRIVRESLCQDAKLPETYEHQGKPHGRIVTLASLAIPRGD